MIKRLKKQNIVIIIIEFLIIICAVMGITYAIYNYSNRFKLKTIELGIDTKIYGSTSLDSDNIKLIPINDNEVLDNDFNVLKINFKVRGSENNITNNIIYDVALVDLEVDCELISEYLKWELVKNEEVISKGNFSNTFDTIVDGRLVLTNIQEDLKDYGEDADNYEFRMWLSDSCQSEDISECVNSVDQTNLLNKSIDGKIEIQLYTGRKVELVRSPSNEVNKNSCITNLDKSNANRPVLEGKMIPVYYDNNTWKIADSLNSNEKYKWYDYDNKMWANVVLVRDYDKYSKLSLGSSIDGSDIVAFYVWVPRYKYQVWNINLEDNLGNKYLNGINIVFEEAKDDTGEISCMNDKCVGNNLEYLTHPAFTQKNIKGFWVAKYETSGTEEVPYVVNSLNSLTNYGLERAFKTSLKILDYGITDSVLNIISDLEWGAVSYLAYSRYGMCVDSECIKEIDSTTNNIYGVFELDSKNNEMVRVSDNILGKAAGEGLNNLTIDSNDVVYRESMFKYTTNDNNYTFRSVLYK